MCEVLLCNFDQLRWLHADCRARHGFVEKLTSALGETPDATLAQTLSICPTIAREVSKLSQDSPSPKAAAKSPVTTETKVDLLLNCKHIK